MGAISALIVGPCVAAPLAAALVYISQSRDASSAAARCLPWPWA
jgi:thiol:disulfide interchange protein DsbD